MDKLKEFYEKFNKIQNSYRGEKTDWEQKEIELENLEGELINFKIPSSKNCSYYYYILNHIKRDVFAENKRVHNLAIEQKIKREQIL